jgi:hypothetical protein
MPSPSCETNWTFRVAVRELHPVRPDRHAGGQQEHDLGEPHARQQAEHDRRQGRDPEDVGERLEGVHVAHAPFPRPVATL